MSSTRPRLASGDSSSSKRGLFAGSRHKSQSLRNINCEQNLDVQAALPRRGLMAKAASSRQLVSGRPLLLKQGSIKSRSLRNLDLSDDENSVDLAVGNHTGSSRGPPRRVSRERSISHDSFSSLGSFCDDDSLISGTASVKSKKSNKSNASRWGFRSKGRKMDANPDFSNQTIEMSTSNRRPRLAKKSSSVRSFEADMDIIKPQDPITAFELYTRDKIIIPSLKDYREAISTLCSDIAHTFLSLLAFLDMLLRPMVLLLWCVIQFFGHWLFCTCKSVSQKDESTTGSRKQPRSKRPKSRPKLELTEAS